MARLRREVGYAYFDEAFEWADPPPQDWQSVTSWHEDVSAASGICAPRPGEEEETRHALDALCERVPHLRGYLAHHQPVFEKLAARALHP